MNDILLAVVLLQTGSKPSDGDQSERVKVVQLPETPPNPDSGPSLSLDGPEFPPTRQVQYPVPGHFQIELTYVVDRSAFDRTKAVFGPPTEAVSIKLEEAYARYRAALSDLAVRMAEVCGTPEKPFENLSPSEREAHPDAQLRFAQAKARAGLEADRRMTSAFEALEREVQELATSDTVRNAADQSMRRWKREALLDYYSYSSSNWQDFNEEIDLTRVARNLAGTESAMRNWLSEMSDSGAHPSDSVEVRIREAQAAIVVAMELYSSDLDALLQKRWGARTAWRDANVAYCKGLGEPRDECLRQSEKRWIEFYRITERARDQVAEAMERAGDLPAAAIWRQSVNAALCPALYADDTLDYAFRWLMLKAALADQIKIEIQQSYDAAVRERAGIRKSLMRAMVEAVQTGTIGHREVGFYRKKSMLPEFSALMTKRNAIAETAIAGWKRRLDRERAVQFETVIRQIRERGMQTDTLDF